MIVLLLLKWPEIATVSAQATGGVSEIPSQHHRYQRQDLNYDQPSAPSFVVAMATSSSTIFVTWGTANDGGVPLTGYVVEYQASNGGSPLMIVRTAADEFNVVLTVLDPSPFYDVTVRAENPIGLGKPSTVQVDMAAIAELDLSFAGNSPQLGVGTINAEIFTNRPGIQIYCFLCRTTFIQDCSNGTVNFTNVPAGSYSLQVVATDAETGNAAEIHTEVFVPESDEFCSVNAINRLVSVSGNSTSTEFSSTGNPTSFVCRLDQQDYVPCTSPFTRVGLNSGKHRLRVRPRGCGRARSGHNSLSVTFIV